MLDLHCQMPSLLGQRTCQDDGPCNACGDICSGPKTQGAPVCPPYLFTVSALRNFLSMNLHFRHRSSTELFQAADGRTKSTWNNTDSPLHPVLQYHLNGDMWDLWAVRQSITHWELTHILEKREDCGRTGQGLWAEAQMPVPRCLYGDA